MTKIELGLTPPWDFRPTFISELTFTTLQINHLTSIMATAFTSLPTIDLSPLSSADPSPAALTAIAADLHAAFRDVGFAYLLHPPLSFSEDEVFGFAKDFFSLPMPEKMKVAKRSFVRQNRNTYRG